jgi:hypothetical protein
MNLKNKAILAFLFAFLFLNLQNSFSQEYGYAEFLIVNNTGNDGFPITLDVYPVGAIFNGDITGGFTGQYTPVATHPGSLNGYIYGIHNLALSNQTSQTYYAKINFDKSDYAYQCDFALGYGKYKIDITGGSQPFSCYVDFSDANYTGTTIPNQYIQQFQIEYLSDGTARAKFNDPNASYVPIGNGNTFSVWQQLGTINPPLTPSKGNFTDSQDPNSIYHSFPLDATNFGFFKHEIPENFGLNLKLKNFSSNIKTDNFLWFDNSIFKIEDGMTFTINSNSQVPPLTFYGESAEFVTGNSSTIICPPENYICLVNNAKMTLTGSSFYTASSLDSWGGIYMENPGRIIVDGCNFTNAGYALGCIGNGENDFKVTSNTFRTNIPLASEHIHLQKCFNANISNNHFYLYEDYGKAIFIYNPTNSEDDNNIINSNSNVIITGNDFHNGGNHIWVTGLTTSILSVYIKNNMFSDGFENMNLSGTMGTVSNNYATEPVYGNENILVYLSSIDFLDNNLFASLNNFYIGDYTYANLSPNISSDNQIIWTGGRNRLETILNYNITTLQNATSDFFRTDYGKNMFIIDGNGLHLYGKITIDDPDNPSIYYSRGNCWYINGAGTPPQYYLENQNNDPVYVISQSQPPISDCNNWDDQIIERIIKNMGYGTFDTILITHSNSIQLPNNDFLSYSTAVRNFEANLYSNSITNFKNFINSYPNTQYLGDALYKLYKCYVSLDTNHNQEWRNIIFGDFKNYLETKIQQYDTNETFVNLAFDFFLKCSIKKKGYQLAMDGYEFIAENSPSATERLMASINYIDVEGLLQGSGGGQKNNYESELSSDRNGKPIKDILFSSYNKTKKSMEKREKTELDNSTDKIETKSEQTRKHSFEKKLEKRAKENIGISGSLTKKERSERIQKDLMLLHSRGESTEKIIKKNNTEPLKYELSQNYPNPFNPITNIKYQIQKTGLVTLKIYDITGREIKTLANEIKNSGSFIVTFNGSEFASGVYFYRIQSGDFVQVKKMVLIK